MIGRVTKISSVTVQPCFQQLWYSRGKLLYNSFNLKLGQALPKLLTGASPIISTQKLFWLPMSRLIIREAELGIRELE